MQTELKFKNLGKMVTTNACLLSLKEELDGITETVGQLKAIMEHVDTLTSCITVLANNGPGWKGLGVGWRHQTYGGVRHTSTSSR